MTFFDPKPVPRGGLHAAATERNRDPILDVLRRVLPPTGLVLEIDPENMLAAGRPSTASR